jgi:hypothetical protein
LICSFKIRSISALAEASSDQAKNLVYRLQLAGMARAPQRRRNPLVEHPADRQRLPNRSSARRSSRRTAARYWPKRGPWNFGSARRRSSPLKVVSARMRPDKSPRHNAPYPKVAIPFLRQKGRSSASISQQGLRMREGAREPSEIIEAERLLDSLDSSCAIPVCIRLSKYAR